MGDTNVPGPYFATNYTGYNNTRHGLDFYNNKNYGWSKHHFTIVLNNTSSSATDREIAARYLCKIAVEHGDLTTAFKNGTENEVLGEIMGCVTTAIRNAESKFNGTPQALKNNMSVLSWTIQLVSYSLNFKKFTANTLNDTDTYGSYLNKKLNELKLKEAELLLMSAKDTQSRLERKKNWHTGINFGYLKKYNSVSTQITALEQQIKAPESINLTPLLNALKEKRTHWSPFKAKAWQAIPTSTRNRMVIKK